MSANGPSSSKAPAQESQHPEHGLVKVQPARLSDLQPRYASTIQHEEDNSAAHGWYARLSKSRFSSFIIHLSDRTSPNRIN